MIYNFIMNLLGNHSSGPSLESLMRIEEVEICNHDINIFESKTQELVLSKKSDNFKKVGEPTIRQEAVITTPDGKETIYSFDSINTSLKIKNFHLYYFGKKYILIHDIRKFPFKYFLCINKEV